MNETRKINDTSHSGKNTGSNNADNVTNNITSRKKKITSKIYISKNNIYKRKDTLGDSEEDSFYKERSAINEKPSSKKTSHFYKRNNTSKNTVTTNYYNKYESNSVCTNNDNIAPSTLTPQ